MKTLILSTLLLLSFSALRAQMWNGTDTLYGNEWIDYYQTYIKIKVAQDGIYKIDFQTLANAGFPIGSVPASQLQLFRYGRQEAIFTSTSGLFGASDFIEFYGEKNRGQVDYYLFEDAAKEQINDRYSMFNDTAVYYLGWKSGASALRYNSQSNDLNNLPVKETFCWSEVEQVAAAGAFKKKISEEITYSWFDGVGYTSLGSASETPVALNLSGIISGAPAATLRVRYAANLDEHQKLITFNDSLYAQDQFVNFRVIDHSFAVPASALKASSSLRISSPIGDRHGLAFVKVRYGRDFNFTGSNSVSFSLDAGSSEQYIEIQGFDLSGGAILYDLTNRLRIQTTLDAGILKVKLPASNVSRQLVVVSQTAVKSLSSLSSVQFQNLNSAADYVIISNRSLFQDPTAGGANRVAEYAAYRSSVAGGSHVVKVVDVEDLYAQFGYGIRFHPIAIRNFLHWAKHNSPQLEHTFIIGKALDFQNFRTAAHQASLVDSLFFVPNFSTPGSDLPFVMSGNHLSAPIVALGRLAVTKPAEIYDYLQKVIQQEQQLGNASQSIASKAWMKRVIHNSGGLSGETSLIRNHTSAMAGILSQNRFGADVHPFYKTSDDPIQLSAYEQLLDLMNDGVALWTIFGHSSAFAVDFDIGLPGSYNNFGRYPLMMVLGCFSGICSSPQQGIGEQFVLAPGRGAIAYIASVNYSYIDALNSYGQQFYQRLGGADYGKSIGLVLAHTVADLKDTPNAGLKAVLHQNLMQGDPAIRIYAHDGPDYIIDNESVKFTPNPARVDDASIKLSFDVVNIGENTHDQLALKVDQRLPDNTTLFSRLIDTVSAPAFKSSFEYELPLNGSKIGFNRFFISLDPEDLIHENPSAAELNNNMTDASGTPGQDVYFYADDVSPVYPPAYGIVSKAGPTLFASTFNSASAISNYLFEFDTTHTFNSPLKTSTQITQRGGLLRWQPVSTWTDSTVYYWRVARDSLVNGQPLWRTRSFIYIKDSPAGWNQSRFGQYRDDTFVNLQASDSLRRVTFQDNAAFVNVQVAFRDVNRYLGFKNAYYQGFYGDYEFNQQGISRGVCMMVVDQNSGRAIINPANGPYNYAPFKDRDFFWFDTRDSLQRLKMMDFVENQVPDGSYVGLLAFNTPTDAIGYAPQFWAKDSVTQGRNIFQVLEKQGAEEVRQLTTFSAAPPAYGFVFRKNHPEFANRDTIVRNPDATAEVRASFLAKWAIGFMEMPVVGPVKSWKSLHWSRAAFDDASDEANLSVLAVREGQEDSLLFTLKNTFETSLEQISPIQFPRLKLRYDLVDTLTRTATALNFARIIYEGLPEGALDPAAHFSFYRDTMQQGDTFRSSVAFANVSDAPFDSLLLRVKIESQQNQNFEIQKRDRALLPGDTMHVEFSALTRLLSGAQRFTLEVNPFNDQPEQYHFNNILLHNFFVSRDNRNPLLDVTFDGQHILDGDLISPKPVVMISLTDENRFLAMRDSNTITLRLVSPDGTQRNIPFTDPSITFFPTDITNVAKKNVARLEWRPEFLVDGEYRLLVNGTDATGNQSAVLDWSVTFKIITKSSISSFLNYPNPFSTSTCFVYTLTGSTAPTHFRIQIMTVAGRVVREITEQEFGPLKPGTHRSDFCWDGKDEFGDRLANGVYLYRIMAKKADGADFEHFENQSVDGFFKHGFGKMVIMR